MFFSHLKGAHLAGVGFDLIMTVPLLPSHYGFPGVSDGKSSACDVGNPGLIPGSGRSSGEGNGNPLQYPCLENQGYLSLVGYSPWGRKESDTTEQLHSLTHYC